MLNIPSAISRALVALGLCTIFVFPFDIKADEYRFASSNDCGNLEKMDEPWPLVLNRYHGGNLSDCMGPSGKSSSRSDLREDSHYGRPAERISGHQICPRSIPSHVNMVRDKFPNGRRSNSYTCNAIAVGSNVVITAATCLTRENVRYMKFVPSTRIEYLVDYGRRADVPSAKIACMLNIAGSPDRKTLMNDIVLVGLDFKFAAGKSRPACISSGLNDHKENNLTLISSGDLGFAAFLPVTEFDDDKCVPIPPKVRGKNKDYFCGTFSRGILSCYGDTGSGLYIREKKSKKVSLVGIMSVAQRSCVEGEKRDHNLYMSIAHVKQKGILDTLLGCLNGKSSPDCICYKDNFPKTPIYEMVERRRPKRPRTTLEPMSSEEDTR